MSDWYELLFRGVLFPLYESGIRRRGTLRYLREYERNQWLAPDQIAQIQWSKLQALLQHCWNEVPYYRQAWTRAGIRPEDVRTRADFQSLPVLEKQDIRANLGDLVARSHRGRVLYKATGGSTGEPLKFGYSRESYERRMAAMWRGYRWGGADIGRRTLYLWGGALGKQSTVSRIKEGAYHAAFGRRMLDAFAMGDANLESYAAAIDRYRPKVIVAYVNPIWQLARWSLGEQRALFAPAAILTGAEPLLDHQRLDIEKAFNCKVFNTYGCREFMLMAAECDARSGLHLNADNLLVEVLQDGNAQSGDDAGDLVVTDLHNYAMPFVRYRNGDRGALRTDACPCGRGLPLLRNIEGRSLDALRSSDGRYLPGEFFPHMLKDYAGIRYFQVVQRTLDTLELRIVRDPGFADEAVARIRSQVRQALGTGTELQFSFVDEIPLAASGKRRVTVSELPP